MNFGHMALKEGIEPPDIILSILLGKRPLRSRVPVLPTASRLLWDYLKMPPVMRRSLSWSDKKQA